MSNAMKKLKLLHHLTAASTTTPAASVPPPQTAFPTPPTSPGQSNARLYHSHSSHAPLYTNVFQSARAALHSAAPPKCLLPGGFMVLTPVASHNDTHPALCVPASPPLLVQGSQAHQQSQQPQQQQPQQYGFNTPQFSASSARHHARHHKTPRQRLTKEALARVGKDSRLARWERVLGYVRNQRQSSPTAEDVAWPAYVYGETTTGGSGCPSPTTAERRRRAQEIREIERRAEMLEKLDLDAMATRSLWSGGSAGTDGVDEFVWSEDEDDPIPPPPPVVAAPQQQQPRHHQSHHQLPQTQQQQYHVASGPRMHDVADDGLFEMEEHEPAEDSHHHHHHHHDAAAERRRRPRSSPEVVRTWMMEEDEMPPLCREAHLDGGLSRLRARRMSAGY